MIQVSVGSFLLVKFFYLIFSIIFYHLSSSDRIILLTIVILLLVTVVLTILYLLYRILIRQNLKLGTYADMISTGSSSVGGTSTAASSSFTSFLPTSAISSYYRNRGPQQPSSSPKLSVVRAKEGGDSVNSSSSFQAVPSSSVRAKSAPAALPSTKTKIPGKGG